MKTPKKYNRTNKADRWFEYAKKYSYKLNEVELERLVIKTMRLDRLKATAAQQPVGSKDSRGLRKLT